MLTTERFIPICISTVMVAVLIAASSDSLSAQTRATTADFEGLVRDQTRAVLPGATVTARNADTGLTRFGVTDGDGEFSILALSLGTYSVTVELSGFVTLVQEDLSFALGSRVDVDYTLQVGGVTEQVTVTAASPLVDTQSAVVSSVISQAQIDNLPINGRNFISFAVITPGVNIDRTPQQGASATSGLTFAGQRGRSNNITVDGLDNNDSTIGSVRATFSQEAVREFQVLTNSYAAEFGKASGGVVNIVTRSGSNTVSGNGFYFFRDDALNRKGYFEKFTPAGHAITRDKAPFSQQQFGGTVGGPMRQDQTFFFLSFERLDIGASNFVTIDDENVVDIFGQPAGTPADILRASGFPVETGSVPFDVTSNQLLAKVDHLITPTQQLSVRFNWGDVLDENIEPWGGQVARSRGALLDSSDLMVAASHTTVLGSKTVNEFRSQVAYRHQDVLSLDPSCVGRCELDDQGGPTLEVTGVASVGRQRFTPQPRENLRVQALNTTSYVSGSHALKVGVDYNYVDHKSQALPLHFGGRYIFAPLPAIPGVLPAPISSIQALALGLPGAYVQGYGQPSSVYGTHDISLFFQDDWQPRPTVSLKLGVRYQKQVWPDIGLETPSVGPYRFPSDNNNMAPRLAVAWDPFNDGKMAIHGAYGIFYDNHITGLLGIADSVDGTATGVRTLLARFPSSLAAWNAPGRQLPESAVGTFPSTVIAIDPGATTPYAHHTSVGFDRELPGQMTFSANFISARGFSQLGTLDYNPILPDLGPGRRPEDIDGVAGTSASILQYTSFGQTWYDGLTVMLQKRLSDRYQFLVSYTLSTAEDNSTDFQSAFIAEDNGRGRDPDNPAGLPIGFDPNDERGPSLQDQRHRFVISGTYIMPWEMQLASIISVGSGRPYNILAGADLNGDGNGGSFPPDRARAGIDDPTTRAQRNNGTLPSQAVVDLRLSRRFALENRASVDAMVEVFNLFNRTNFIDVNNIFGVGSYPNSPSPTFGQFQQAAAPLQVQLALKVNF